MLTSFAPYLRILKICAGYSPEDSRICYKIYSRAMFTVIFIVPWILEILDIITSIKTIKDIPNVSVFYTTEVVLCCRLIILFTNKQIKALLHGTTRKVFQPRNSHERKLILASMSRAIRNVNIYLFFVVASTSILGVVPILTHSFRNYLPIGMWYPFDISKTGFHDFAYFFECISLTVRATSHAGMDSLPLLLMMFICGQLDIITDNLKNLESYASQDIGANKDHSNKEQVHKRMNVLLVQCVRKHNEVRRLVQELNSTYSYHLFTILANAMLVLSLVLSRMVGELKLTNVIEMLLYFCAITLELLQFNWYGNEIMLKSSVMYMAAYEMDWPDCPISFKKNLLFALVHLQQPLKVCACDFFLLSLESFVAVLRLSWSYFLVLHGMNDENL